MRLLLVACVVLLIGCELTAPPGQVVAGLRVPGGLLARCTGDPLPNMRECQSQGEQAFIELARSTDRIRDIDVHFEPIDVSRCRAVTWTVRYASGTETVQPTQFCVGT